MLLGSIVSRGCVVLLTLAATPALSQTPPQPPVPIPRTPVIPPPPSDFDRRLRDVEAEPELLPRAPVQPRLGRPDEDLKLNIKGYAVPDSAPAALRDALPSLTEAYVGPDRTFGDITNAARAVTRYLQSELGYYLGFAYIPDQDPKDGVVQIAVLEGRLDDVELVWGDDLPVDRAVVEAYLAQLKPGGVLLVRDVERIVFLVNDLRGISADFEVRPGRQPGTARFVVTARATERTSASVDFDNYNAPELGDLRLTGTITRNSPFGRGDSATLTVMGAEGLAFVLGNYTSPIGSDGARLGLSLSALKYRVVKGTFEGFGIDGTATTVSAFGLYPQIRSRNANLFLIGSLDAKTYDDYDGNITNNKRINAATFGVTGDTRDTLLGGGINSLGAQLVGGRVNIEIPPAVDAPATNFTKLGLRGVRLQNLVPGQVQAFVAVRLQKAFDNLDVTEQFHVGGADGVRAFAAGEGNGDDGAQVTAELRLLPPEGWLASSIGGRATVSLFVDWATIRLRNDTSGQLPGTLNTQDFGGAGIGLLWEGGDGWSFRASVAGQFQAPRGPAGAYLYDRGARFFGQLSKQF